MPNPFGLVFAYMSLIDAVIGFIIGGVLAGIFVGVVSIVINEFGEGKKK